MQPFARCQDVKFVRVEDQPFVRPRPDRVPIIGHLICADPVHIENIGMFLRPVADHATGRLRAQANPENKPVAPQLQIGVHKGHTFVTFAQLLLLDPKPVRPSCCEFSLRKRI